MSALLPTHTQKTIAWIFIVLIMFYSVGCKYYKVKQIKANQITTLGDIGQLHKSFFIHHAGMTYSLHDIHIDSVSLSGMISHPNTYHYQEFRDYRIREFEQNILNEVHIYLNPATAWISRGPASIPFSSISKITIVEKDSGKTAASYIFGGLGIILGVFVIIGVIVALTKSSCPYVYSDGGEGFVFEGEIFGGAIASNLQREDYVPLKSLKSKDDLYKIRISNELKERQYTDLAELLVVEHEANEQVLLDKFGVPHIIKHLESPQSALSYSGEDLLPSVVKKDSILFLFNDEEYSRNGIVLRFDNPTHADEARLVITGKNTLWFDYQFGEFLSLFGSFYDGYMEKQSKVPQAEREQLGIDNDFPLSISIKNQEEWITVERLNTIGPLASRDFVVPIDLSNIHEDYFEIKLETGFMFWEVDAVGIDFTSNQEFEVSRLKPISAKGTGSNDWIEALASIDHQYMAQEESGDIAEIVFRAVEPDDQKVQSCFLHTSGYYELVREFEGLPDLVELNKFKTNGYFSDFSRANYLRILNKEEFLAKNN